MTGEQIARVCHEANRAYCVTLGDHSQPTWSAASNWQKESAVNGVRFHIDNPGEGPERSHTEWYNEKQTNGWVYGPAKDPAKKEHPCMVPYDDLPEEQKRKDALFIAIVRVLTE